jgi:hypothetical protein
VGTTIREGWAGGEGRRREQEGGSERMLLR